MPTPTAISSLSFRKGPDNAQVSTAEELGTVLILEEDALDEMLPGLGQPAVKKESDTAGLSKEAKSYVSKMKKFLFTRDIDSIRQGIELARALGDIEVFGCFLKGVVYDDDRKGMVPNRMFVGSGPAQPYLNFAILGLIAYSPEGCAGAVGIRKRVKVLKRT